MQWTEFSFLIRQFPLEDQHTIQKAFEVGQKAHAGQKRKSGEEYFTHPIAVAQILIQLGADRDTVVAALLHDTVEDTDLTLEEIEGAFGGVVAMLINGVTKLQETDVGELATIDKKIETLRKMFTLMQKDVRIMVIKLADRLHNMQTLSFRTPEQQMTVAKETHDVYVKIADRLCMRDMRNQLEELCLKIQEPETYSELVEIQTSNQELAVDIASKMKEKILGVHPKFHFDTYFEKKSWEKLRIQHDVQKETGKKQRYVSIVYVCDTVDDCYRILGGIHSLWPREKHTFDDFINIPIINGYKALHTTILFESGIRIVCKIRTKEMDAYAQNGIATKCFGSAPAGVLEYLLWTERISSLSEDTKNHSDEFWETLQKDVLSESITIYSADGRSILIPMGATALDGALYLHPDDALYLTSLRINGKVSPFSETLEHGSMIEMTKGDTKMLRRDWLYWVQTGLGIAMVRAALSKDSNEDLEQTGILLLQKALTDSGGGYVEEFDQELINQCFITLGYHSPRDAYIAIANRHLEPSEIISTFDRLYRKPGKPSLAEQKQECTFRFSVDRDVASLRKMLSVYERYNVSMKDIRLMLSFSQQLRMRVHISLTPDEQEAYRQELAAAGAKEVTVSYRTRLELTLMAIVVICWALNPVWAKYYLTQGISPLLLVSLRSILFFCFSAFLFVAWRYLRGKSYSPIPRVTAITLLPALCTFLLSLLTYLSVSYVAPSVHLTILRFNVLLLPILQLRMLAKGQQRIQWMMLGIFITSIVGFFMLPTRPSHIGLFYALLSLFCYMGYSVITEWTLRTKKIGLRYPHFLFHLSLISGICGLLFAPLLFQQLEVWIHHLQTIIFYVLFCVFIPHTCFHIILQRTHFRHVAGMSLLEVPLAVILEFMLLGIVLQQYTYALISVVLVIFLLLLRSGLLTRQAASE